MVSQPFLFLTMGVFEVHLTNGTEQSQEVTVTVAPGGFPAGQGEPFSLEGWSGVQVQHAPTAQHAILGFQQMDDAGLEGAVGCSDIILGAHWPPFWGGPARSRRSSWAANRSRHSAEVFC